MTRERVCLSSKSFKLKHNAVVAKLKIGFTLTHHKAVYLTLGLDRVSRFSVDFRPGPDLANLSVSIDLLFAPGLSFAL